MVTPPKLQLQESKNFPWLSHATQEAKTLCKECLCNPFYARRNVVIYLGRQWYMSYQRRVKNVTVASLVVRLYARTAKATAPATKAPKALLEEAAPVNRGGAEVVAAGTEGAGVDLLGAGAGEVAGGAGGAGTLLGATGGMDAGYVGTTGGAGGAGALLGATGGAGGGAGALLGATGGMDAGYVGTTGGAGGGAGLDEGITTVLVTVIGFVVKTVVVGTGGGGGVFDSEGQGVVVLL
jgi:hypothetical protein